MLSFALNYLVDFFSRFSIFELKHLKRELSNNFSYSIHSIAMLSCKNKLEACTDVIEQKFKKYKKFFYCFMVLV